MAGTWTSSRTLGAQQQATVLEGEWGEGEEDPRHLQAGGCPAETPVVVGLCAVWEPSCGGAAALLG